MVIAIIIILIILWLLGYLSIPGLAPLNFPLFIINGQIITVWILLIFIVVLWAISILPNPFRAIAAVLLLLWVLSVLGILAIPGLASLLVIAIIIGLIISLI